MKTRQAFNFYKSYFDILPMMNKEEQLDYLIALLEKQFYGIEPNLKGQALFAYTSQKHSIDKQVEGWESKTKTPLQPPTKDPYLPPTEPPTQDPTEPPYQQEQGKGKEQEEVKEEEQVKVKEQKKEKDKLKIYNSNKSSIHYIMDLEDCSVDEAITIFLLGEKDYIYE
jgi:hypothetical protein